MKNYKEYKFIEKAWYDYWSITFLWPALNWGRVDDSMDYDAFISGGKKYAIDLRTSFGYYNDVNINSVWLILFGFGFSLKRQDGY